MIQAFKLLLLQLPIKDEAMLNSEEIKPAAIATIELCLSDGINK